MKLLIKDGDLIDPAGSEETAMNVLVEHGPVAAWISQNGRESTYDTQNPCPTMR